MHKPLGTLVSTAVIGVLATGFAHAGAFSLYTESSVVATGNFGAGIAAEAADASTGWYNPAGLALIHNQQAVFGGVGVFPTAELTGSSTFRTPPLPNFVQTYNGLSGGENGFVPSFHYALPLGENATFGLSVVAPFGLATDWGMDSPVRYEATFTELLTTNISPQIGAKVNENFAVGAGIDLQYARVKFNRILGFPTIVGPVTPGAVDSLSYNKGDSYGVGFHAGVMGMFNDTHTRIGVNYQSKMRHQFHGYSQLTGKLAAPGVNIFLPATVLAADPLAFRRANDLNSNSIQLPDVVTLSGYHDLNDTFAVLGSVVYTGWNSFQRIQLNNVVAPSISGGGAITLASVNSSSPQNYNDVWRAAIGANYRVNSDLLLRVGGGYDATPTNDIDRDVRLPDADRWALSVGAHYQMRPAVGFDVGYTHLFGADDPTVNRTDPLGATASYSVNAIGKVNADIVGAQVVWTIDQVPEAPMK